MYIALGLVVIGVVALALLSNARTGEARYWGDTQVQCLPNGHANLAVHIHPELYIITDGVSETVPGNIGVLPDCMAEIHTHESDGAIHVETVEAERADNYTLEDFFSVWGMGTERDGYTAEFRVNGKEASSARDIPLRDGDRIEVLYMSVGSTATTSQATTSVTR